MNRPKQKRLSAAMSQLLAPHIPAAQDEPLTVSVGAAAGRVAVQLPKPVQIVTLTPEQAETFAQALSFHAAEARLQLAGAPSTPAAKPN